MSIIIEIGGFLGGVLSEYARKKNWTKLKTFIIVSFSFFIVGAFYVALVQSAKDTWIGILIFLVIGVAIGLVCVLLMSFEKWCKDRNLGDRE
jgi:peptidoglycan/LPS O-acetylase OafA/YrhL